MTVSSLCCSSTGREHRIRSGKVLELNFRHGMILVRRKRGPCDDRHKRMSRTPLDTEVRMSFPRMMFVATALGVTPLLAHAASVISEAETALRRELAWQVAL